MMPDLDRYAGTVLGAYGLTIGLLLCLVLASCWRAARVKRAPAPPAPRGPAVAVLETA